MYSASYSSIIIPIFIESLGALHVEKLGYWTNMQTKKISFNMAWREKKHIWNVSLLETVHLSSFVNVIRNDS